MSCDVSQRNHAVFICWRFLKHEEEYSSVCPMVRNGHASNKIIHLSVCDPLNNVRYEWRRYLMLLMSVSLL